MSDLIYVILVNYNQANYTLDCINSIINTGYSDIKILVIDNSTQQDNKDVLDLFIKSNPSDTISLIRNEGNLGYVGGINLGLNEAKRNNSEYILIMNNDTLLDKHAIINLLNTCKEYNNKAIISGKVYHYDDPQRLQQIGFKLVNTKQLTYKVLGLNEFDEGQYDAQMQMDLLDDVFWFFNINLYKEIGGYNTYFWFNSEQADFALRAKKAGYLLVYSPKAKIWHKGSASLGGRQNNPKLAYWHIQSTLIFHFLHQPKIDFIYFYLRIHGNIIISALKLLLTYNFKKNTWLNIKAKAMAIKYFNNWLFVRNENTGKNPF